MNTRIKLVDATLPVPSYQTEGSVAFDLYARTDMSIEPMKPAIIPLNVVIEIPEGHMLLLASRSSTPLKKGLMVANGIGVIDQDYCGDSDEIGLQVINFTQEPVTITKGERIAQAMFVKISKAESFEIVSSMKTPSRGGFGSTGGHVT